MKAGTGYMMMARTNSISRGKMAEAKMAKLIAAMIKAAAKPSNVPRGAFSGIAKTYCTSTVTSRYESMASTK